MAAKTIEADNEGVFTFALAGAPVTDWRFYDSLYTERYMKTIDDNLAGFNETALRNTTNFANLKGMFGVAHGTGDDNVHFQNTAAMLDLLVGEGVSPQKLRMGILTDSDHALVYNGANTFVNKFYAGLVAEELEREDEEEVLVHQWSRRSKGKRWVA